MSKSVSKSVKKVCEKVGTNKIVIFTDNLKIDGNLFIEEGKCEECHDDILTLTNALVCRLSDYCNCEGDECNCDDYVCFKYDWLNLNIEKIVAYSVIV